MSARIPRTRSAPGRVLGAAAVAGLLAAVAQPGAAQPGGAVARPSFRSYAAPDGLGEEAIEPTLGVDPRTGTILFLSIFNTLRITELDAGGPGRARWQNVTTPLMLRPNASMDPILETDRQAGRTWVSQLQGACSRMAFTDDVGGTWTLVPLGCAPGALWDHQSVGAGPFRPGGPTPAGNYPNAVYYCAHDGVAARCGVSADGGRTFGPAGLAYPVTECESAFGHLKTAPDGTAYLPPFACDDGATMGMAVSDDNATTWRLHRVAGAGPMGDALHPSVDAGADGTVYFAWGRGAHPLGPGPPYAAVSRDQGRTWTRPARLGRNYGIVNTRFVTVVAGDGDRAAVAYLGSATPGDGQSASYAGRWDLYVSFSYDRGRTWTTVRATDHPVQVGPICSLGIQCTGDSRNLADFIDSVIDRRGRVLVSIADGCPGSGPCTTANRAAKATLVRQVGGLGLLRRHDRP